VNGNHQARMAEGQGGNRGRGGRRIGGSIYLAGQYVTEAAASLRANGGQCRSASRRQTAGGWRRWRPYRGRVHRASGPTGPHPMARAGRERPRTDAATTNLGDLGTLSFLERDLFLTSFFGPDVMGQIMGFPSIDPESTSGQQYVGSIF